MATPTNMQSQAGTNATLLYGGPAILKGWALSAHNIYPVFVKFYDLKRKPNVGVDKPAFKISVQANTAQADFPGAEANSSFEHGIPFQNGIAFSITKLIGDGDATAVLLDDCNGTLDWYPRN